MKRISEKGLNHIILYEGLKCDAYLCPAGKWTIGIGHTGEVDGVEIHKEMTINVIKAKELLRNDLAITESYLNNLDALCEINQSQFDALVSFVFNVGIGNFLDSTMYRKIKNKNDVNDIANEFPRWIFAGGKKLNGLIKRREDEKNMYLSII